MQTLSPASGAGFSWQGGMARHTSGIHICSQVKPWIWLQGLFVLLLSCSASYSGKKWRATGCLPHGHTGWWKDKNNNFLKPDFQGTFDYRTTVRENMTVFALSTMTSSGGYSCHCIKIQIVDPSLPLFLHPITLKMYKWPPQCWCTMSSMESEKTIYRWKTNNFQIITDFSFCSTCNSSLSMAGWLSGKLGPSLFRSSSSWYISREEQHNTIFVVLAPFQSPLLQSKIIFLRSKIPFQQLLRENIV